MNRLGKTMVLVVIGLTLSLNAVNTASAASKPKGGGNAPGNFRVIAKTAYTVTLAWDAPSGSSGDFTYQLWGAYNVGPTVVLPKTATSYTFTALYPGNYYTFGIYTKDASGKASAQANLSNILLPSDITPPTTGPIVSINEVGANYAHVSWIPAQDDGPHLSTYIYLNGIVYASVGRGVTNTTLRFLRPATSYSLTARAVDFGYNVGPLSSPITLTTAPANPGDVTAPTIPSVWAYTFGDGSTEMQVGWSQSTDDFDMQANIRYDVYVNGVFSESRFGSGGPVVAYGEFGDNVIEVFATDTAGNTSEPGVALLFIP
jgi:hypothetical protein